MIFGVLTTYRLFKMIVGVLTIYRVIQNDNQVFNNIQGYSK